MTEEIEDTSFAEAEAMLAALEEQDIEKAGGIAIFEPKVGEIYSFIPSSPGTNIHAQMGIIKDPIQANLIHGISAVREYSGEVLGKVLSYSDDMISWDIITVPSASRSKLTRALISTSRKCVVSNYTLRAESSKIEVGTINGWAQFNTRWVNQAIKYRKDLQDKQIADSLRIKEEAKAVVADSMNKWTEILDMLYPDEWCIELDDNIVSIDKASLSS